MGWQQQPARWLKDDLGLLLLLLPCDALLLPCCLRCSCLCCSCAAGWLEENLMGMALNYMGQRAADRQPFLMYYPFFSVHA